MFINNAAADKGIVMKGQVLISILALTAITACSTTDVGTRIASIGEGTLASEQRVTGKTILIKPRLEDVTEDSFNVRYIEMSFGTGTPVNVRDMAIAQCESIDKVAMHKGNSRGLIQANTVKAYYECVSLDE